MGHSSENLHAASYVREYLHDAGYPETLSVFQREHQARGAGFTKIDVVATQGQNAADTIESLLEHFDRGERGAFFNLWDNHLKETVRAAEDALRLEFYCSIYFAIFPVHPFVRKSAKIPVRAALETFKAFLETRGSHLSKTPEFLAYYALPYMSDPQSNPTLAHIFTNEWVLEVRSQLLEFAKHSIVGNITPKLVEALNSLEDTKAREASLIRRHQTLQADYHNLLSISSELVNSLATTLNGQQISHEYIESILERLQVFRRKGQPGNLASPRYLNYDKIKAILSSESQSTSRAKQLLLSALRGRISQHSTPQQKRLTVKTYIDYDIFGFFVGNPYLGLFSMKTPEVCEQAMKLTNLLCCFCSGRNYFASCERRFLSAILSVVRHANVSHCAIQNALGVLEKMSMRASVQNFLIKQRFVTDLVGFMQDSELLNETIVIYICSQLMNICMRIAGRNAVTEIGDKFLSGICEFLENEDILVRAYVHGLCFSALESPFLREKAQSVGMQELLICLRENSPGPLLSQLNGILAKFEPGYKGKENSEEDNNSAAEEEDFEEEVEQDDPHDDLDNEREINLQESEVAGNELLQMFEVPDCRSQGRTGYKLQPKTQSSHAMREAPSSSQYLKVPQNTEKAMPQRASVPRQSSALPDIAPRTPLQILQNESETMFERESMTSLPSLLPISKLKPPARMTQLGKDISNRVSEAKDSLNMSYSSSDGIARSNSRRI